MRPLRGRRAAGRAGLPHRLRRWFPASVAEALGIRSKDAADPMAAGAGAVRSRAADRARQLRARPGIGQPGRGHAGRTVPPGPDHGHQPGTPGRARRSVFPVPPLELPDDGSVRAVAGSKPTPVHHPRPRGGPRLRPERGQLGRDRRGVCPAGRHAAGHRAGCGPVPGARARAARPPAWRNTRACCPAAPRTRGSTAPWKRWCRGAMTCSMTPNDACWTAYPSCAAASILTWPNACSGEFVTTPCGDRRPAGQPGRQVAGPGPGRRGDPLCANDRPPVRRMRGWPPPASSGTRPAAGLGAGAARSAEAAQPGAERAEELVHIGFPSTRPASAPR